MLNEFDLNSLSRKALMQSVQIAIAELTPKFIAHRQFANAPEWEAVKDATNFTKYNTFEKYADERLSKLGKTKCQIEKDIKDEKETVDREIQLAQNNLDTYVAQQIDRLTDKQFNPKNSSDFESLVKEIDESQEVKRKENHLEMFYKTIKMLIGLIFFGLVALAVVQVIKIEFLEIVAGCFIAYILNVIIMTMRETALQKRIKRRAVKIIQNHRHDQLHFYQHDIKSIQYYYENEKDYPKYNLPLYRNQHFEHLKNIEKNQKLYDELVQLTQPLIDKYRAWYKAHHDYMMIKNKMIEQFPKQFQSLNSLLLLNGVLESQRAQNWSDAANLVVSDQYNERQLLALYDINSSINNVTDSVNNLAIDMANQGKRIRHEVINEIAQNHQETRQIAQQNQQIQQQNLNYQSRKLDNIQSTVSTVAIMNLLNKK